MKNDPEVSAVEAEETAEPNAIDLASSATPNGALSATPNTSTEDGQSARDRFAAAIRAELRARGLSGNAFASFLASIAPPPGLDETKTNLSQSKISMYSTGASLPTFASVRRLAWGFVCFDAHRAGEPIQTLTQSRMDEYHALSGQLIALRLRCSSTNHEELAEIQRLTEENERLRQQLADFHP